MASTAAYASNSSEPGSCKLYSCLANSLSRIFALGSLVGI